MDVMQGKKIAEIKYSLKDAQSGRSLRNMPDQAEEFLLGAGLMLDDFEENITQIKAGDNFNFVIRADRAYGLIDPHAIFDMPLSTFEEEDGRVDPEVVQVGHVFPMADKDGNRHFGKIIRKMADSVTMDFNHPLAGKDLLFEGQLIRVRDAQHEDLERFNQNNT